MIRHDKPPDSELEKYFLLTATADENAAVIQL